MGEVSFDYYSDQNGVVIYFDREFNRCTHFFCRITKSGNYECPLCLHTFVNMESIARHLVKTHIPCPHCEHSFVHIKKHVKTHDTKQRTRILDKAAYDFVERHFKKGHSLYEIDKAIGRAFGYFVP